MTYLEVKSPSAGPWYLLEGRSSEAGKAEQG